MDDPMGEKRKLFTYHEKNHPNEGRYILVSWFFMGTYVVKGKTCHFLKFNNGNGNFEVLM